VRVKLGMPKHRQYLRLVENPTIRRHIEKKEMEVSSDQNRGMLQLFKDTMFFSIDEKHHDADLSEMGRQTLRPADPDAFVLPDLATQFADIEALDIPPAEKVERRNKMQEDYDRQSETMHNISQLLKAYCLFAKDQHYMVVENKVIIVDENTGRAMPGRRFSDGLHQALEAKENVAIERETQTLATVTIQNYFRMYEKLAGMTGTAETEANEFSDIYKLNVLVVPTNRPCLRIDHNDRIFKTKREKYRAIVEEVRECHERGQPVLLGTISVEDSEVLSRLLKREKVPHNVLNAKQHMREAEIVADAGQRGSVTIATNMAGRGTDIRLGQGVKDIGGLHVIGSARHDSRRIDRQLRGRCSRQGDPGSSRFYISLEDDLMRLFGSDRIAKFMERFGFEEGEELSHPWLNRSIETAQRRVEEQHFSVRKRVLEYDDVMNKQREVVYGRRKDVLYSDDPRTLLFDYIDTTVFDQLNSCVYERAEEGEAFDVDHFHNWLSTTFPIGFSREEVAGDTQMFEPEPLVNMIIDRINETYTIKESGEEPEQLRWLERQIMLSAHDELWQEHLYTMDSLRTSIGLMQFAQRDPLVEYKSEAYRIFGTLLLNVNSRICSNVFRSATSLTAFQNMLSSLPKQEVHRMFGQFDTVEDEPAQAEEPAEKPKGVTYQREQPKVGRNDPCPCGSEKKYKHCHGR
jgi:preprotein translocase subunit SecA